MSICTNCSKCSCKVFPALTKPLDTQHKPILVIGETVTALEARKNERMTGPGAGVLKQTMQKVGMPFEDKYVCYTTATACAIPKKKGANTFPKDAIANCRTRLLLEIQAIKPAMILVCGKVALQTLTGDMNVKVTTEYGRPRHFDYCGDAIVIPIMNPGLIIRSPGDYKPFLGMMQLAASIYGGGSEYDTGETTWEVLDTREKMFSAWSHMHNLYKSGKMPYASYDMETTGLDYRVVEFLVMGMCYEKNKTYIIPREMREHLHNFTEGVPWKIIWHHGKYDKKVIWRRGLGDVQMDHDTIYMHYALDETSAHDLGYLSKTFLQAEEYKYKMNQNWKVVSLETYASFFDALCERAAVDTDYTFQLTEKLLKEVEGDPKLKSLYYDLLIPGANFLSRVEQNGILVNPDYLNVLNVKYEKLLLEILGDVQEEASLFWDPSLYREMTGAKSAPAVFNPGSPQQMAWMVFDRLKLKPRIKKARSTDKDILKSIEPMPLLVKKVLQYRTTQKEKSTYVEGLLNAMDDDGRVRTTFNLHVTATGRLSSKEPNVQNQPSANGIGNIRKAFIAKPGYVLAEIDYSGAELRWLAFLSKCPVLMDVFIEGRNLHTETSIALFGENYTKQQKMRAKAVNFGIPYGREAQSFVDEFNITKQEAHDMVDGWLDKYYGARDYLSWCAQQVIAGNYLETPFGRRRRFGLVTKEALHGLQNEARNFPIQSASSDLLLVSAIEMEKTLKDKYDTKIINLVHDSLLLEIPADKEIVRDVGTYANMIMTEMPIKMFNCPVPFKTDYEIGLNWGELVSFNSTSGFIEEEVGDQIQKTEFNIWLKNQQIQIV